MYNPGVPGFSLLKFNTIPLFIQKKKKKILCMARVSD